MMENLVKVTIGGLVAPTLKGSLSSTEGAVKSFGRQVRAANQTINDVAAYKNLRSQIFSTVSDIRSARAGMDALSLSANEQKTRIAALQEQIDLERKTLKSATDAQKERRTSFKFLGDEIKRLEASHKSLSSQIENSSRKSKAKQKRLEEEKKVITELRKSYKEQAHVIKQNSKQIDESRNQIKKASNALKAHRISLSSLGKEHSKSARSVDTLSRSYMRQKDSLGQMKGKLESAGFAVKSLASEELRLASAVRKANASLQTAQKWDSIKARNRQTLSNAPGQIMSTAYAAMQVAAPILAASSFESSRSGLRALTDPGKESEVSMLSEKAMALGRDSRLKYSAVQIMDSMKYMKMAGTGANDINKSISDVLKMAMAGDVDASYAADIGTNIMSAFGLKGGENMGAVGNILTKAFTSHNLTLPKIAETMRYVGPLAGMLKVKEGDELGILTKVSAMAGILGNKGIDSSTAGTGIRKLITSLSSPTGQAKNYLDSEGIETVDDEGNLRPLDELITQLAIAMENDGTGEKAKILKDIFGEEALAAASALTQAARSGELKESISLISKYEGTLERISRIKMDNVIGSFENLKASAIGAAIEIGKTFLPAIKAGLDTLRFGANTVASLARTFPGLTAAVVFAGAAITSFKVATLSYNIVRAVFSDGLMIAARALYFMTGIQLGAMRVTKAHTLTSVTHGLVVKSLSFTYGLFWKAVAMYSAVTSGSITITGLFSKALLGLRAVFAANPLGLMAIGIGAAVTYAYQKSEWFREKIQGLWQWVQSLGASIFEFFGLFETKAVEAAGSVSRKMPQLALTTAIAASPSLANEPGYEIPKPRPVEQKVNQTSEYSITINISGANEKKAADIKDEVKALIDQKIEEIERKRRIDERRKLMDRSKGGMF